MGTKRLSFVIAVAPLFASAGALGQGKCGATIFYGNGVDNTRLEARASLGEIRASLRSILDPSEYEALEFKVAFNRTEGQFRDSVEAAIQLSEDVGLDPVDFATAVGWILGTTPVPDELASALANYLALEVASIQGGEQDVVDDHVALYRTEIAAGRRVAVVAHSQGNLFVNRAYEQLSEIELPSLGVVAVGTPAGNVIGKAGPYTTSDVDAVIRPIPGSLPSNAPNAFNLEDKLGHRFLDSYVLQGNPSRELVLEHLRAVLAALMPPPPEISDTDCGEGYSLYSVGPGSGGFFYFPDAVAIQHHTETVHQDGSITENNSVFLNDFSKNAFPSRLICQTSAGEWISREVTEPTSTSKDVGPPGEGLETTTTTKYFSISADGEATFRHTYTLDRDFTRYQDPPGLTLTRENDTLLTTEFVWNVETGAASYDTYLRGTYYSKNDYDPDSSFEDWVSTGETVEAGSGSWAASEDPYPYGFLYLVARYGPLDTPPPECL